MTVGESVTSMFLKVREFWLPVVACAKLVEQR